MAAAAHAHARSRPHYASSISADVSPPKSPSPPRLPHLLTSLASSPPSPPHLLRLCPRPRSYNELATLTISRSSAVTASVANTAKRAFVIVGVSLALGRELRYEEQLGATLAIGAVMLYSMVDSLPALGGAKPKPAPNPKVRQS